MFRSIVTSTRHSTAVTFSRIMPILTLCRYHVYIFDGAIVFQYTAFSGCFVVCNIKCGGIKDFFEGFIRDLLLLDSFASVFSYLGFVMFLILYAKKGVYLNTH